MTARRLGGTALEAIRGAAALLVATIAAPAWGASCSLTVPGMAFGSYDVFSGSNLQSATTLSATCTMQTGDPILLTVNYTLTLSTGGSGSYALRKMASGANLLNYNLYTDAARTLIWGNGTGGSNTVAGSMNLIVIFRPSQTNQHTIYGNVPALQDVGVGSYSDPVVVTVTW